MKGDGYRERNFQAHGANIDTEITYLDIFLSKQIFALLKFTRIKQLFTTKIDQFLAQAVSCIVTLIVLKIMQVELSDL